MRDSRRLAARSAVVAAAVVAEAIVVSSLIGWSTRGVVLACVATILVFAAADAVGGAVAGGVAAAFWVIAPAVLHYWRADFRPTWHHEVLPVLYGAHDSTRLLAGIALLAAVVAQLRLRQPVGPVVAVVLVLAGAALVRIDNASWSFSWTSLQASLDHVREFGWSRRIVEYIPLAGVVAVLLRRGRRGLPLVAIFICAVVLPLAHDQGLVRDAFATVPGLPIYAVLAGALVLLIPRRDRRV
jgi:hypothetical protein